MAFKKIPLTIDTMIRNPVPIEGINQEDNIELNIVVTENKTPKDLSSQTIKVYVRRIDGTLVEQTNQITLTNARKGEVTVKLKNSAFNKEGYALFQLDVSDSIGRITSSYATFKIGKGLVSGEAIANTNEIEALKKVEEYIKKANQELETFKQTVAEINENEATRQENEVVRVREEASRNEAEAIRTQQEATRKEKENERVQAETKRIADEEVRRENEVLRGSKELERKQAEELRKEKELLRIADENNRKVAESKRIEAESVRVEAEKLRVTGETERVEAESLRVIAEEKRVAAETKREEGFNKFEGKINSNTKELKAARTATTGEKFNTLDERIDCEVDRLNKKIEVSFLQQEDKESHTIDNTVDGMTTDMVIKGRTLQNLCKKSTKISVSSNIVAYSLDSLFDLKGKELTIITDKKDNAQYAIYYKPPGGSDISIVNYQNNNVIKFTVPNLNYGKLYMWIRDYENIYDDTYKFVILEGDWTNKPIPQYFEGIKSFGQQEDKISILSYGKNLLSERYRDKSLSILNIYRGVQYKQFLKENTQYTLSLKFKDDFILPKGCLLALSTTLNPNDGDYIRLMDSEGNVINNQIIKKSLKMSKDLYITFFNGKTIQTEDEYEDFINKIDYIQIQEGTQATQYEAYKEDKKDILLQNLGFDEGLRGFDLTICDELNDIKNVAIKRIEKHIFNATEVWQKTSVGVGTDVETIRFQTVLNQAKDSNKFIANFPTLNVSTWDTDKENMQVSKGVFYVRIKKNKLETQDVNGFVKWLKSNPITVYYELAEPVETPLGESINVKTFGERTYVSFENTISGTSSFKAPVDSAATISRLNRENRALEEENKNLRQDFESTTLSLTDSDLELVKQNVDIDFRLMEVEFALDIPQSTLSSNINFKKKGEVKSMARTPYAMMKIVILSGDYDREDYIHKVGKYYERGRMTKEEYDELMSLMTADEVIGG